MTVEIVILAMIAAFLGLRLYSVLGRRAEHRDEPVRGHADGNAKGPRAAAPRSPSESQPAAASGGLQPVVPPAQAAAERGLRDIAAADRRFDALAFLEGARSAYRMILEAFWRGDRDALRQLCDGDVYESFAAAIAEREAAGETIDNRLVRIEDTSITEAEYRAPIARVTVSFRSDIAAVTRDASGAMIAGSLNDAVEANDVWTFTRNVQSPDPDWLLEATDEA